jgi:transcriptional regulator with XRE-family HTH domain
VENEPTAAQPAQPPLRTLADKVNWLIQQAHPAGRAPYSNTEIAALVEKVTGEPVSHTTIWKLRNGQATNPQMRLIAALAHTFGVPPAFFFDDYSEQQSGLLQDQVELLALVRAHGVTTTQLRALLTTTPEVRQAITNLITATTQAEAEPPNREHGQNDHYMAP